MIRRPGWVETDAPAPEPKKIAFPVPARARSARQARKAPAPAHRLRKPNRAPQRPLHASPAHAPAAPSPTASRGEGDGGIVRLARKFKTEAIASLIEVIRNPRAPPSAKTTAARTLIEIGHGRPQSAKAITTADLDAMTSDQRVDLWSALFERFEQDQPGMIRELFEECCIQALREREIRSTRYTSGLPQPHRARLHPQAEGSVEEPTGASPRPSKVLYYNSATRSVQADKPEGWPEPEPEDASIAALEPRHIANNVPPELPLPRSVPRTIRGSLDSPPISYPNGGVNGSTNGSTARPNGGLAMDRTFSDYRRR